MANQQLEGAKPVIVSIDEVLNKLNNLQRYLDKLVEERNNYHSALKDILGDGSQIAGVGDAYYQANLFRRIAKKALKL